jgi:adenosine deaminase
MDHPLSDLHRHLDGSLRPSTMEELATALGVAVPTDLVFSAGMGLGAALSRFQFTLKLLQTPEAVHRVAAEMCEDAASEGVTTLEIRFAPQLHTNAGASIGDIIDAAVNGAAGRAGIILCGLYGESPDVLMSLVYAAESRPGVVGIDLAGGPHGASSFSLADYAIPFRRAAELGLGRTVHAGEGRPADEIRTAVKVLGAQRIGHGTSLLEDDDVLALVLSRNIVIEACPTSNVHTGVISCVEEHPISKWLDRGVRVTVCADNTLFSATHAAEELRRVMLIPSMTEEKRIATLGYGHAAAFPTRKL